VLSVMPYLLICVGPEDLWFVQLGLFKGERGAPMGGPLHCGAPLGGDGTDGLPALSSAPRLVLRVAGVSQLAAAATAFTDPPARAG
jgi:hypothetical protein